eukprot:6121563-Amphidinium_carterae.1
MKWGWRMNEAVTAAFGCFVWCVCFSKHACRPLAFASATSSVGNDHAWHVMDFFVYEEAVQDWVSRGLGLILGSLEPLGAALRPLAFGASFSASCRQPRSDLKCIPTTP